MIWHTLIDIVVFSLMLWGYRKLFPPKPILYDDEWISIDELPEITEYTDFIITDGERTKYEYGLSFNREGKCVYEYYGTLATHWRYLPKPPKKG
jgi:hypothetical protein